jgi:hypothetical protein
MAYTQPTVRATGYKVLATDWNVFVNNELQRWTSTGFAWSGQDMSVANGYGQIVGHASQITQPQASEFQILGTASVDSSAILGRWGADANAPALQFVKSRDAVIFDGSYVIVADNDKVGGVEWYPDDGVDLSTLAADFHAEVDDGSPAAGDVGMAFVWDSMAGGGAAIAERMRLSAAGDLSLVTAAADMIIPAAGKYYLDGGGDTYIYQESADDLHVVVGGTALFQIDQDLNAVSIGAIAPNSNQRLTLGGAFTGAGGGGDAVMLQSGGVITSGSGTVGRVAGMYLNSTVVTQSDTESVGIIAQLILNEPGITDNLTGDITVASTIYVSGAPTEGETNAAIYVASGDVNIATTTASTSPTTGALQVAGGLGVADDIFAGTDVTAGDRMVWGGDAAQSTARAKTQNTQDVGTGHTEILDTASISAGMGGMAIVCGKQIGDTSINFVDIILFGDAAGSTITTVSSANVQGTADARNYDMNNERKVRGGHTGNIDSGHTYDINVMAFGMGEPQ